MSPTSMTKTDKQLQKELKEQLGRGPMRFGPVRLACSIQVEVATKSLSKEQVKQFAGIQAEWETIHEKEAKQKGFSSAEILRVARFCAFDKRRSLRMLKLANPHHFRLSAIELGGQLRTRTLFPCPGMKTREGYDVFYMRPSRYFPNETPTSLIIDNLVFVLDKMVLQRMNSNGIAFIANMEGWTMSNFCIEYCRKFMYYLQGRAFPAKVDQFLILNPPSWFGKVWAVMKTMMTPSFRQKVHMIDNDDLLSYMDIDFEEYMPNEVRGGDVDTGSLVRDFVLFYQTLEQTLQEQAESPLSSTSLFFRKRQARVAAENKVKGPVRKISFWGRYKRSNDKPPNGVSDGPPEESADLTNGTSSSRLTE